MAPSPAMPTKKAFVRLSNATPSGLPAGAECSVNTRSFALFSSWPFRAEATVAPTASASTARTAISVRFMWVRTSRSNCVSRLRHVWRPKVTLGGCELRRGLSRPAGAAGAETVREGEGERRGGGAPDRIEPDVVARGEDLEQHGE